MRTARSSSRLVLCMLGYTPMGLDLDPPGVSLGTPQGVGLETPPARPSNLPPGCRPGDPPARPLNLPLGCGPGDPPARPPHPPPGCGPGDPPSMNRMTDKTGVKT